MNVIEARNLGKWFRRQGLGSPTLLGSLPRWLRGAKPEGFWALRELNFSIRKGQTVGVIGPNGSGKSSLLGLVAQTMTPRGIRRDRRAHFGPAETRRGFHPDSRPGVSSQRGDPGHPARGHP